MSHHGGNYSDYCGHFGQQLRGKNQLKQHEGGFNCSTDQVQAPLLSARRQIFLQADSKATLDNN